MTRARPALRPRSDQEERLVATRPRNAETTRQALLAAANLRFIRCGYDRTTVRDIAADVGVNAALIFRYFGNKAQLFKAATANPSLQMTDLRGIPAEEVPALLYQRALATGPSGTASPFTALLRSSAQQGVAAQLRRHLADNVVSRLAELVDEPDAELRGDLFVAVLIGIGVMRSMIKKQPLAGAASDTLASHVEAIFAVLFPDSGAVLVPSRR